MEKNTMKFLVGNDEVLLFLTGEQSLISSSVESFLIKGSDQGLSIEVVFRLLYSKTVRKLLLRFDQVSAYVFQHDSESIFYHVELYKLLKVETGYYLSMDPYDEMPAVDGRDNDFILASAITAFEIGID